MGKFNPSKYATEYIKNHYKRKEIKLKPEEFDILEFVLNEKNVDLKKYIMEYAQIDYQRIKNNK